MDAWNSRRSFARRLRALAGVALLVASSSPVRAGEVTSPLPWVGLLPSLLVAGAAVLFAVLAATIERHRSAVASISGIAAECSASVTSTWRESTNAASTPCSRNAAATIRLLASSPIACRTSAAAGVTSP